MNATARFALLFAGSLVAFGCTGGSGGPSGDLNNDPPLADIGELKAGAPKADEIERIGGKADELLPSRYDELIQWQSPVKSQGRRGVCSIFATVGLMESLYITEGTYAEPDFSEQYLQWSVKFELGTFPNSSGSNSQYNLNAISRFGIPEESAWPYEINQWGVDEDAECDGEDDQPTRCYTNGSPPQEAVDAEKFKLPSPDWLHPYDIKSKIHSDKVGVLVGLEFFYQSWNHRKSPLPVNSDYWSAGYVLYPNTGDFEASTAEDMSAGHAILLIGWDDDLEVPTVDEEGNPVVDSDGNPVVEKGFYIFKNSWGTSGFGIDHDLGAGYGYISMRYVHEYGSAVTTGLPDFGPQPEVCGDGRDNDRNGLLDCADVACFGDSACSGSPALSYESNEVMSVPDGSSVGISSEIEVADEGTVANVVVDVRITHAYIGDLRVSLHKDGKAVVLHDHEGGSSDNLVKSFAVRDFAGSELAGAWQLVITDSTTPDMGTLEGWTLHVQTE